MRGRERGGGGSIAVGTPNRDGLLYFRVEKERVGLSRSSIGNRLTKIPACVQISFWGVGENACLEAFSDYLVMGNKSYITMLRYTT